MKYIDIHCHLDFPDYGDEIPDVLERMRENEVGAITIGCDLESSKRAVRIAEESEKTGNKIWACIGVHPADNHTEIWNEEEFEKLVQSKKVVAVGECGLDFFRLPKEKDKAIEEKERQTKIFRHQIDFALKHDLPLMLHCRNAYNEVLDILEVYKKEVGEKLRGNSHFFAGNLVQAKRFLEIGFTMSFTGVVTFTHDYDDVIKFVPIESIMSETDAPFVAPVPYRGKRNEPAYVIEVVKKLAELKGLVMDEMAAQMGENARKLFGLKN